MAGGILNALMANPRGWGMSGPSLQEPEVGVEQKHMQIVPLKPNTVRSATTGEVLFSDTGKPSPLGAATAPQQDDNLVSILHKYGLMDLLKE